MDIFEKIIKLIACFLLMFFDLAAFGFGLGCLAGGGEHDSIKDCITMGAILLSFSLLCALGTLHLLKFSKEMVLASLIMHEIVLVCFLGLIISFPRHTVQHITAGAIMLLLLICGLYAIVKVKRSLRNEGGGDL